MQSNSESPGVHSTQLPTASSFLLLVVGVLFVWNAHHYWALTEDAFISFRYAKNLADGHGLVWNPGYSVEGYTNFLFVILMAAGIKLGIAPEVGSLILGYASAVGILLLLVNLSAGHRSWRLPLIWAAPCLLAANKSFVAWSGGGLATQFFAFLILASLLAYIREAERRDELPLLSALTFAAATLTRPEGLLFAAVSGAFFLFDVLRQRRRWRPFLVWAGVYGLIVSAHIAFRLLYYGQLLPNTFYAKVSGLNLEQGLHFLSLFVSDYRLAFSIPLALLPIVFARKQIHLLFAVTITLYLNYIVYIGGGYMGFRLLVTILPLYFWLVAEGLCLLWDQVRSQPFLGPQTKGLGFASILSGTVLLVGLTQYGSANIDNTKERHGVSTLERQNRFAQSRAEQGKFLASLIDEGLLPSDTLIATRGTGALPYYSGLPTVDIFGLNDKVVAHLPIPKRGKVGHEKVAPRWYIEERKVAMVEVQSSGRFDSRQNPCLKTREVEACFAGQCWYRGPLRCIQVKGSYLVFGTTLSPQEFQRTFGHLKIADEW